MQGGGLQRARPLGDAINLAAAMENADPNPFAAACTKPKTLAFDRCSP